MYVKRKKNTTGLLKNIGLLLGPIAFIVPMMVPVLPTLQGPGRAAAATTAWMAVWWITEAIPIAATALLPIILFPLTGVLSAGEVTLQYGNPLIFLFLGGFLLSAAIQKWNLHKRIALRIILTVGLSPARIVLGFMVATAFLSMWISNTATALMMIPIGLAVIHQMTAIIEERRLPIDTRPENFNFGISLMLSIAYGASIGGLGTIIGSPPNAIFAGFVETALGETVSFTQWLMYGLPLSVIGLALCWFYLTRIAFPVTWTGLDDATSVLTEQYRKLGPMSRPEKRVAAIFAAMALLWIGRGLLEGLLNDVGLGGITDTTISIAGALALFLVKSGEQSGFSGDKSSGRGLIDWQDTAEVPWGILLLFGGGLTLAKGIDSSGAALWLAEQLVVLQKTPPLLVILAVTVLVLLLTEVSSNTATATVFMPVMVGLATALGVSPQLLMVAAATAASCAFMLPVATPPNAIVFGSGYITPGQMLKAGFGLNAIFIVLITALVYWWLPVAWGINLFS